MLRVRVPELLEERGLTVHAVAQLSAGRVDRAGLYRLVEKRGRPERLSLRMLEGLCAVLRATPGELFEMAPKRALAGPQKTTRGRG
jgi:DNA-binding Xre family transcriptional regulator